MSIEKIACPKINVEVKKISGAGGHPEGRSSESVSISKPTAEVFVRFENKTEKPIEIMCPYFDGRDSKKLCVYNVMKAEAVGDVSPKKREPCIYAEWEFLS